jgi:hypothetical protein
MLRKGLIGLGLIAGCLGLAGALPGPQKLNKVGQVLVKVADQHPGLAPGLTRHLLEDLGDEPLQALLDVHADLRAHYPNFDKDLAGLLEHNRQDREQLGQRFPRLRSWFLGRLHSLPEQPPRPRAYLAQHHSGLMIGLALKASQLVDEKYPELPARWREQRGKQGLAAFVLENCPEFPEQWLRSLSPEQRQEMRQAALGFLKEREAWAQRQPAGRFQKGYQELLTQFPGLVESRQQARADRLQARQDKFPGLRQVVLDSLRQKHPQLLEKARQSVDKHYPELRQEFQEALRQGGGEG